MFRLIVSVSVPRRRVPLVEATSAINTKFLVPVTGARSYDINDYLFDNSNEIQTD